jgi:glyoxylase-like metal-dependent hydrolase (beta-lactamase superfamily II)
MLSTKTPHHWVALFAVAATVFTSAAPADDTFGPMAATAGARSYKLGSVEFIALHDARYVVHNDGKTFGVDAGPAAVGDLLKANKLPDDRVMLSVNALLVRTGSHVILIDTGLGPKVHGALMASLAEAGVSPKEVTEVLITHSHGDHVGGLSDGDGKLAFPKAVIRMSATEWAWMKSQPSSADLVKIIDGHVRTFTPGTPIAPGITPLALDGHTPGHVGYEIVSGKQTLLDIGDLAHSSVVSLKKPEWTTGFDSDSAVAKATRKTTLARLAATHELVFSPHFPYPGVGHIVADGDAYAWVPAAP